MFKIKKMYIMLHSDNIIVNYVIPSIVLFMLRV